MATYQKYRDSVGQWRWRLRADNGRIISDSGEAYIREADCDHGIALSKASRHSPVERLNPPPYEGLLGALPGLETLVGGKANFARKYNPLVEALMSPRSSSK